MPYKTQEWRGGQFVTVLTEERQPKPAYSTLARTMPLADYQERLRQQRVAAAIAHASWAARHLTSWVETTRRMGSVACTLHDLLDLVRNDKWLTTQLANRYCVHSVLVPLAAAEVRSRLGLA